MPTNYPELYFPVLVQIVIAFAVSAGLLGAGLILGKHVRNSAKDTPYESGMQPVGSARERFSVKFYLVAMVFILFDIEAIFLYPWAVVYRELNKAAWMFPFFEMLLFILLVLAGFFYIWKKGVLDWSADAMDAMRDKTEPQFSTGSYTLQEETPGDRVLAGAGTPDKL